MQSIIEQAWEDRTLLENAETREAIDAVVLQSQETESIAAVKQERVCHCRERVVVQVQHLQRGKPAQRPVLYRCDRVGGQVQQLQRGEPVQSPACYRCERVVVQAQLLQRGEPTKSSVHQ